MSSDSNNDRSQQHDYDDDAGLVSLARHQFQSWLTELAGIAYSQLISDRAFAESCVRSADDRLRAAALVILSRQWLQKTEASDLCLAALSDPSPLVVQCAVTTLGWLLANTQQSDAGKVLATIARDTCRPWSIRVAAYRALVFLHSEELLRTLNIVQISNDNDFDQWLLDYYS